MSFYQRRSSPVAQIYKPPADVGAFGVRGVNVPSHFPWCAVAVPLAVQTPFCRHRVASGHPPEQAQAGLCCLFPAVLRSISH